MLLYTGGMVLDPVVHAMAGSGIVAPGHTELAGSDGEAPHEAPFPAADDDCEVCKLARGFAAAAGPAVLSAARVTLANGVVPGGDDIRGPPFVSSLRSRAPPSA